MPGQQKDDFYISDPCRQRSGETKKYDGGKNNEETVSTVAGDRYDHFYDCLCAD
jgi:hypothetical protein